MPESFEYRRSSTTFDVAIGGAGLAGSSLALRLANRGAKIALLDPSTFPRDKLCGEYLSPESWGVLDRIGLADEVRRSEYHAIRRVRISTPRGRVVEAQVTGTDGLPGIGLSRSFLDHLIVRRAISAGVEVFQSTRVSAPIVHEGRVVGLSARSISDGLIEIRARVTVAADGRHSTLVRQTGDTRARSRFRARLMGMKRHFRITDAQVAEPEGTVGLHLVPGGYGGTCRIEGSLTNLCALLPESEVRRRRGDLERVARECLALNPILKRILDTTEPAGDWKAVAGVRVEVSTPRLGGILYAGDSQGTVDPLGGQGMTMALLGAELLAPFIERALRAGGAVDASLQAAYSRAWRQRFNRRVRLCRLFHHVLVNPALIDLAAMLGRVAPRILSACYHQTRDREPMLAK
jgi:menaquinone-9 beta-reductase